MPPPANLTALDYAPRPPPSRRWARRLVRWWPAPILLALAGLGVQCAPAVWRHWQVMRLQEACMTAELPQDRPLWEAGPATAQALVAGRPAEYQSDGFAAVRVDPRWAAQAAELDLPRWDGFPLGYAMPTTFCHERRTPDRRRRLVVVEDWGHVTVIEPAEWSAGRPRVAWRGSIEFDATARPVLDTSAGLPGPTRPGAGVPDPADQSRFTIPFEWDGVPGTFEYRLGNDDRVTMRLLDPEQFRARTSAARTQAATRPGP